MGRVTESFGRRQCIENIPSADPARQDCFRIVKDCKRADGNGVSTFVFEKEEGPAIMRTIQPGLRKCMLFAPEAAKEGYVLQGAKTRPQKRKRRSKTAKPRKRTRAKKTARGGRGKRLIRSVLRGLEDGRVDMERDWERVRDHRSFKKSPKIRADYFEAVARSDAVIPEDVKKSMFTWFKKFFATHPNERLTMYGDMIVRAASIADRQRRYPEAIIMDMEKAAKVYGETLFDYYKNYARPRLINPKTNTFHPHVVDHLIHYVTSELNEEIERDLYAVGDPRLNAFIIHIQLQPRYLHEDAGKAGEEPYDYYKGHVRGLLIDPTTNTFRTHVVDALVEFIMKGGEFEPRIKRDLIAVGDPRLNRLIELDDADDKKMQKLLAVLADPYTLLNGTLSGSNYQIIVNLRSDLGSMILSKALWQTAHRIPMAPKIAGAGLMFLSPLSEFFIHKWVYKRIHQNTDREKVIDPAPRQWNPDLAKVWQGAIRALKPYAPPEGVEPRTPFEVRIKDALEHLNEADEELCTSFFSRRLGDDYYEEREAMNAYLIGDRRDLDLKTLTRKIDRKSKFCRTLVEMLEHIPPEFSYYDRAQKLLRVLSEG